MTSTILARGSKWSINELADGWGEETPDEWVTSLIEMVVDEFHNQCQHLGIDASWHPNTSEVIGRVNQKWSESNLDEIRERAIDHVWNNFVEGHLDGFLSEVQS